MLPFVTKKRREVLPASQCFIRRMRSSDGGGLLPGQFVLRHLEHHPDPPRQGCGPEHRWKRSFQPYFQDEFVGGGGGSVESENVAALWSNVRIPPQKIEIVPSSTSTSAETSKPGNEKKNYFCISLIKPSKVNLRLNVIL